MAEQAPTTPWCPRCLRSTGPSARCPECGLEQLGPDADRLRVLVWQLHDIGERQQALEAEAAPLRMEQAQLIQALSPDGVASAPRAPSEWRPELVRGVLLWLGAILLALAAVIFAVVAFISLGDLGRAGLLAGTTLAVAACGATARRRLPATGEALGGLTLALVLVDWYALRRAGLAEGLPATAWWALGTAVGAGIAALAARWLPIQHLGAAALVQACAVLVVTTVADALWTVAVGFALVAAASSAAAVLARRRAQPTAAIVFGVGSALLELATLGLVVASPAIDHVPGAARPAAALAAMALAPALARAWLRPPARRVTLEGLVAVAAAALLGSGGTLLAAEWRSWALLAALAVLGALAIGLSRLLPAELVRGATLTAVATLGIAVAGLLEPLLRALAAPPAWAGHPWTGRLTSSAAGVVGGLSPAEGGLHALYPVVVMLLACAGAAGFATARLRGARAIEPRLAGMVASGAAVGIEAVLPMAVGWPLWAALLCTVAGTLAAGAGAVLFDRDGRGQMTVTLAVCSGLLAVVAISWALATATGTLAVTGLFAAAAAGATVASRSSWLRLASAWCAAAAALGTTWAGMAAAGVTLVEAYTLPAAGVVLAAGAAAWRDHRHRGSWPVFGPGIAMALLPSLMLTIDRGGLARPLLLTAGALLAVLGGVGRRLQAPLLLGAFTLVALGVDAVLPVAAQLPRWLTIGSAGLLLVWLGATTERRLTQLREPGPGTRGDRRDPAVNRPTIGPVDEIALGQVEHGGGIADRRCGQRRDAPGPSPGVCSFADDVADERTTVDAQASDRVTWRHSSHCWDSSCLEVAWSGGDVLVRDSKDPGGLVLRFSRLEWQAFLDGVRSGEFQDR
jgi:Domain of unknown function (DUF397)